jgi:predicted permease
MLLARRRPSVTEAALQREVAQLAADAYRAFPSDDVTADVTVGGMAIPLSEARVRPEGRRAAALVAAGSVVLFLLAMANLAALQMSKAVAQRRESAVTLAMGASHAQLWRMLVRDGAMPVAAGALVGLAGLAMWLTGTGVFDPLGTLGRGFFGTFTAISMDMRVVGWWALTAAGALLLAAALPAYWATRRSTLADLRAGSRGSAGTGLSLRRPGTPAIILGVEAALAVILVIAAAQLLDSYRRMQATTIGVEPDRVLTFEVQPSEGAVPQAEAAGFIDRVLESVRTVPGVISASVDGGAPLAGSASTRLHIVGQAADPVSGPPLVLRHYVGPDHFSTLGIPLRAGRAFTDADREGAPGVVIISESAARQYFPDGDALGRRVWFSGSTMTSPATAGEIVGVVGDVKYDPLLGQRTTASFYTPYKQFTYGWRVYFVKAGGDPMAMARPIAAAVGRVAPELPLHNVRPLADVLSASSRVPRRAAYGTGALAVLGLLLAASGIWAVVSHAVAQRTKEMAIRVAHGATTGRVIRLVLTDGLAWPAAGLLLGVPASLAASAALGSFLYEISPGDPVLAVAGAGAFLLVAAAACLGPALRAARVNPIDTLRAD